MGIFFMSENSTVSLFSLLEKYRNESFSERDKGTRFERLIQAWLRTDPLYARDVETVWLWNEFPHRSDFGGRDTGIDLVVRTVDGEFWAVQCKFYVPDTTITKASVDTFLSTSSRTFDDGKAFSRRLWISTGEHWNGEAENTVVHQIIPFTRISLTDLSLSEVRWDELDKGIYGEKALAAKKRLRPHQEKTVAAVHEHFKTNDRGRLIMAGVGQDVHIAENSGTGSETGVVPCAVDRFAGTDVEGMDGADGHADLSGMRLFGR